MEFDLEKQPEIVQQAVGYALQGWDLAKGWLLSPEAWSQFGLLVAAYVLAVVVSRKLGPVLHRFLDPGEVENLLSKPRRFVMIFLPLLLPLLAYVFTGIGEGIVRSIFDSGAVIPLANGFSCFSPCARWCGTFSRTHSSRFSASS